MPKTRKLAKLDKPKQRKRRRPSYEQRTHPRPSSPTKPGRLGFGLDSAVDAGKYPGANL